MNETIYFFRKISKIQPDGKCSKYLAKIKVTEREYTIFKTRLIKVHIDGKTSIKCPACRNMLFMFDLEDIDRIMSSLKRNARHYEKIVNKVIADVC
ncbi:MAG: hypothetical protein JETT_3635 [Candidatus Jettenia ecosi]|uniref:Uncharacterized protein n=1 Tax=Candidatus Jettenia ecosi TaxID=2494326 RepID=A0A533Q695_9BACT|nr:MAG: hypothetical protein JETT_3635 [Candidatus Jettenia ecosi]